MPDMSSSTVGAQQGRALDMLICVTVFRSFAAQNKTEEIVSLRSLAPRLRDTSAPSKAALPWLKLAQFGEARTAKGSYRHDANVRSIHGIEADYDGEVMTLDRARQILAQANVAAVIYTSPSHKPDAPRWRVLCPTSTALPPEARAQLVARLNGLFLGALASESFTLSQSYYFGHTPEATDHTVLLVEGQFIDLLHDLDAGAVHRAKPPRQEPSYTPTATTSYGGTPYGRRALDGECHAIRNAGEGQKHHTLNRAAYSIGGLVACGELDEGEALGALRAALFDIRDRCDDFRHAEQTLETAFADGKAAPRSKPAPLTHRADPFGLAAHTVRIKQRFDPATGEILEDPKPTDRRGVKLLTMGEVEALPPVPWLIHGLIPARSLVSPWGPPKAGKTFIVLSWALHVAAGLEWMGRAVTQGPVVYVVGEGLGGFATRLLVMREAYGIPPSAPLFIVPRAVNFNDPEAVAELCKAISDRLDGIEPVLIVIDTLARAMPGVDESSSKELGLVIAKCDEVKEHFRATVMPIHHAGKDVERGMRGSNALLGAVDASYLIQRAGKAQVKLINDAMKDAEEAPPMVFDMEQVRVGFRTSVVPRLRAAPGRPAADDKPSTDEMLMRVLLAMNEAKLDMMRFADVARALNIPNGRAQDELRQIIPLGMEYAAQVGAFLVWKSPQGTAKTAPLMIHRRPANVG